MIDRLIKAIIEKKNPSVVGLDPTLSMMPDFLKVEYFERYGKTPKAVGEMFYSFNCRIIDAVADIVPAIKPQIAMYEQFGLEGLSAYMKTCAYAASKELLVIGDIKRGDISSTAEAYSAHLSGVEIQGEFYDLWHEDAVTINPYMGSDGIAPFLDACKNRDKGIFVLVKTSNPSSSELQDLLVKESGFTVYEESARLVISWGESLMGENGYSKVGAVVGATCSEQGQALRRMMPSTFFLVPGYGAQGASAADLAGYFDNKGLGALINSSRGITGAYQKNGAYRPEDFADAARNAAIVMKKDLAQVCSL